ncbi:MAG: EAL domain-containing protein [Pseudomonadota bacterium]
MNTTDKRERNRLDELYSYEILDTPVDVNFDRLARLAAKLCDTPIALVTLVDQGRQWFKSVIGLDLRETDRAVSFCSHTIAAASPMIVPDARQDATFADNPLVTGAPGIVFYAGIPLVSPAGIALGTLAVIDIRPRILSADQLEVLETLAEQIMGQLELRRQGIMLRRATEARTRRRLAELQMLSRCNEALTRATNEHQLMSQICALAVEVGGYDMAWVSYAQHDAQSTIAPVACFPEGERASLLLQLPLRWSGPASANEPCAQAIVHGSTVVCEDFAATLPEGFGAQARKLGYGTLIALPLVDKDGTFGMLALLSAQRRDVMGEETALLHELVNDLAFGIANLRAETERNKLQQAVIKVAAGVSASSGAAFFEELVRNMAEAVGAEASFLAQLLPGSVLEARTLVALIDGKIINNFTYALAGTPCENLAEVNSCLIADHLEERYGVNPALAPLVPRAYVGRRLVNSSGKPIGLLFVLFAKPLKQADFIASTLQIFAARAASELERQVADARILDQAALLDKAQDAIIVRDFQSVILFWNKGAERLYGWRADEALGRHMFDLMSVDQIDRDSIAAELIHRGEWSGEIEQRRKDGSTFVVEGHWSLVSDGDGTPKSVLEINTDITKRKADEEEILQLAFYDSLTHLPNRALLLDRLGHALAGCSRTHKTGALLFIDLDHFKSLNDTLGHDKGDLLLQQVAQRLLTCVRYSDTVARLGGDEFVILMENLPAGVDQHSAPAHVVAEKILNAFGDAFNLGGYEHRTTPSIGIAQFDEHAGSIEELLRQADLAMYQAKEAGRNTMRFFDPRMQAAVSERVALEHDLREALERNECVLYYQPQLNAQSKVIGAEALIRWRHPQRGMVPPNDFIGLAEETGLIIPLGQWVLRTACDQLASWATSPRTAHFTLAVNVSICQFRHPGFVGEVLDILIKSGANPRRLKLELTESLLIDDVEATIAKMGTLKQAGIGFSLDDFGTGYSSLGYLKRLPLDQLKIDQSFVRDIMTDPNDAAIARTVVALGHSLGLAIIAEGVETEAQRCFLVENGCTEFQGYLFSKPLPIAQFHEFLAASLDLAHADGSRVGT